MARPKLTDIMSTKDNNEPRQSVPENFLLINAIAPAEVTLLSILSKRIADSGCNIVEARISILGREACLALLASGSWDAVAKLDSALARLQREDQITLMIKRSGAKQLAGNALPYAIEVIAADRVGILYQLADFFARRNIVVETLNSSRYRAAQTGAEMFSASLSIGIPANMHISGLRDEFLEFCDSLNLDAILEPIKG
jgi:glycine cleavage system transcriptional repressor